MAVIVSDTDGRALLLVPHPASVQDRFGAGPVLQASRRTFPFIEQVFADAAYASERVSTSTRIAVEIVTKRPDQVGFAVTAFLYAAYVLLLTRRIARS